MKTWRMLSLQMKKSVAVTQVKDSLTKPNIKASIIFSDNRETNE